MQSVPITTKIVSSNPVDGEVYSIQHYVVKLVSDLRQVNGFLQVLWFPPLIKLATTISLKYFESGVKHHKPKPNLNQYYLTGIASFGHSKFLFLFIFSAQKNVLVVEVSKVQNKELVFDLEINSTDGIIKVSMSGSLCVSTHYSCFEDVDILRELTLDNRNKVCFNSKL